MTHQSVPRRLENEVGTPEFDWHSSILKLAIFDTSERPKTSLFDPLKGSKKQIGESLKGKGGGVLPNQLTDYKRDCERPLTIFDTSVRPKTSLFELENEVGTPEGTPKFDWNWVLDWVISDGTLTK